jgi:predicted RNA polymerase sigma factor
VSFAINRENLTYFINLKTKHETADSILKLGRKKEGLAAYKKSLELNPKNEKAAELLMRNR